MSNGFWFGGFSNQLSVTDEQLQHVPEILKLGRIFQDFQNGPYRGEWNQKWSLNFGTINDLLAEIARLLGARGQPSRFQINKVPACEVDDLIQLSNVPGEGCYAVSSKDGWYAHLEAPEISVGPFPTATAAFEELFKQKNKSPTIKIWIRSDHGAGPENTAFVIDSAGGVWETTLLPTWDTPVPTWFNLVEYQQFYGIKELSELPTHIDIVDIGYSYIGGYEPPVPEQRQRGRTQPDT